MPDITFKDLCDRLRTERPYLSPSKARREVARLLAQQKVRAQPSVTLAPRRTKAALQSTDPTCKSAIERVDRDARTNK